MKKTHSPDVWSYATENDPVVLVVLVITVFQKMVPICSVLLWMSCVCSMNIYILKEKAKISPENEKLILNRFTLRTDDPFVFIPKA